MLLENCSQVADFFSQLVAAVSDASLQLQPDDSVSMLEGMVHPYQGPSVCPGCVLRTQYGTVCTVVRGFASSGYSGYCNL